MKKVVQFVSSDSVYTKGLQKELAKCSEFANRYENEQIILDEVMHEFEAQKGIRGYSEQSAPEKMLYWYGMNRYLLIKFGYLRGCVVNIHYVSVFYVMLLPFILRTFDRIVLSFWGSDLLRQNRKILFLLKILIRKADVITFPTSDMEDAFHDKIGNRYNDRLHVVRFGNCFLDDIDNANDGEMDEFAHKYRIDTSRKIVSVGYNRFRQHRHIEAITSIIGSKIDSDSIFIVVPWTYGPDDEEYRKQVEELLSKRYQYVFLNNHLDDSELVSLRRLTDIQIIVPTTDALNATMLEVMYAGKEVIIGSWLKYSDLYRHGVTMHQVDDVRSVGEVLIRVIQDPMPEDKRLVNKEIIKELYTWKNVIGRWVELYG